MTADRQDFCPICEVSMDLHNSEDDCENAAAKADLIDHFWGGLRHDRHQLP